MWKDILNNNNYYITHFPILINKKLKDILYPFCEDKYKISA